MNRDAGTADKLTPLLLRAQGGDAAAFGEFYAALAPAVRSFARSLDGQLSPQDHDDLVQEVFLRTWQGRAGFRGEASAKTYVLAITRNVVLKRLSRLNRCQVLVTTDPEDPAGDPSAVETLLQKEARQTLRSALAQLTDVQRQAVDLALIRELPRAAAAKLADCNATQFAQRLQRAVRSLSQILARSQKLLAM